MHLYHSTGALRYKSLKPDAMNKFTSVEMVLLNRHIDVFMSDIGVITFPG